jgi:DNA-binding NarL/FixJ family response regulator
MNAIRISMPAEPPSGSRADDPPAGTIRVLLAVSEPLGNGSVGSLLEAHDGIDVVGAAATDAATIALARRSRPDVVLIDSASGLHVLATARRLLAEPDLARTQVLLFGRFEREEDVLAALRSGIGGLVDRDAEPDEIVRAVRMSASGAAFVIPGQRRGFPLRLAPTREARQRLASITAEEREAVTQAARGQHDVEIARQLAIGVTTVRSRLSSAMRKVGARDRSALVVAAYETGLVEPEPTRVDHHKE